MTRSDWKGEVGICALFTTGLGAMAAWGLHQVSTTGTLALRPHGVRTIAEGSLAWVLAFALAGVAVAMGVYTVRLWRSPPPPMP